MKSAPAVIICAKGAENLTTPFATSGNSFSKALTTVSNFFFPVPRTTIYRLPLLSIEGRALNKISTPFYSSSLPINPIRGTFASIGRPNSAYKASLAAALPSSTLVSEYLTSKYLSFEGFHSVVSIPFTIPSIPFYRRT